MKSFRSALLYLAAAALIGGYIFFFERGPEKKPEEKKTQVFSFAADDVQGMVVEGLGSTPAARAASIELGKDEKGVWQILSPLKFKADESTLRGVLDNVGNYNPEVTLENPANLADYGLNSPTARVTFKFKNAPPQVLLVGSKNAIGSSVYIKSADKGTVYLLPSATVDNNIKTKVEDYRDRVLLKTDTVAAKKFRLARVGTSFVLEKDAKGNWSLTAPLRGKADEGKVREILNQVNNLRIEQFVEEHPKGLESYGLKTPKAQVEIWPADGGPSRTFLVGKKKEKANSLYLKDKVAPAVSLVAQSFDKSLDVKLDDLRDKSAMKFEAGEARKLTLRHGSKSFTYQKNEKDSWVSDARPKAGDEADTIIGILSQTTATGFAGKGAATGLKNPSFAAEVALKDGTVRKFNYGAKEKDKVYLASDKGTEVYLVTDSAVNQMQAYFNPPAPQVSPTPAPAKK